MIAHGPRPPAALTAPRALLAVQAAALALPGGLALVTGVLGFQASHPESPGALKFLLVVGLILTAAALAGAALAVALPHSRRMSQLAIAYESVLIPPGLVVAAFGYMIVVLNYFTLVLALAAVITVLLVRHLRATRPHRHPSPTPNI